MKRSIASRNVRTRRRSTAAATRGRGTVAVLLAVAAGVLATALAIGAPGARAQQPQQPPPKPAAQDGFVPVDELPAEDQLPAAPLLIAAYAAAWLAILGYMWSIWRRLGRVEQEIAALDRRISAGGRGGSSP